MIKFPHTLEGLYYKQKGICFWCKRMMVLGGNDDCSATRDHIIPKAKGGKVYMKRQGKKTLNVVASCKKCNNERGQMPARAFGLLMQTQNGGHEAK